MSLFAGMERSEYQDVLRAVGRLLDIEGLRRCRLIEHKGSLILQARLASRPQRGFETYLLTDEDIQALLRDAYRRRGTGQLGESPFVRPDEAVAARPEPMRAPKQSAPLFGSLEDAGYQGVLRAIGRLMDREGFYQFRLIEQGHGIVLQVRRRHNWLRAFETYLLPEEDLLALLRDGLARRGTGVLGPVPA